MKVRVIKRSGLYLKIVTVTIADTCQECAAKGITTKRGKPYHHRFHEDGDWYTCDRWDNPCGHIDKYASCLKEAKRLANELAA